MLVSKQSASFSLKFRKSLGAAKHLPLVVISAILLTAYLGAQTTASIKGAIKDMSGAVVPEAMLTIKNVDTGLSRSAVTDANGTYSVAALPVGQYEIVVEKTGFKQAVRRGLTLVVGQQLVVDMSLEVGGVEQQVTVTAEAPLVNTTLSSTAGLISENQVKDLPLNGRSFDQLLTLNVGATNYSSSSSRNAFAVSGMRPNQNRFLLDGVDYVGVSNGLHTTPYGSSGQVLGVEAVREFSLQTDTYGAEYGVKAGGQVSIVTQAGTNRLHGSAFEYLRNDKLDARNFFDAGEPAPFKRNQFGGALGGPIMRDKLFLFGTYEGFRQRLGSSGQEVVPDMDARRGFLPVGPNNSLIQVPDLQPLMLEYMKLWREPNGPTIGGGTALAIYSPVNKIREDYGTIRVDHTVSSNDSWSGTYMIDDGLENSESSSSNTISNQILQSKLVSVRETRIFSPTLLNQLTLGYTRAYTQSSRTSTVTLPARLNFNTDSGIGGISIGGQLVSGATAIARPSGNGRPTFFAKNLYTFNDTVNYTAGSHSLSFGLWIQRHQINTGSPPSSSDGSVSYATLLTFLQDRPTAFQGVPNVTAMGFRTTLASWFVQDDIRLQSNLNLRLGLRHEMQSGYNEKNCQVANYEFDSNGIINTEPFQGCSALTENNGMFLFQPRVGIAWDPTGTGKWSIRAAGSIIHDLQDDLVHRLWNPPLNGVLAYSNTPLLSIVPIPGGTLPPPTCNFERVSKNQPCSIFSPGGLEPTFNYPTTQQWSFTVERQLSSNLMLRAGYVGSQSYHMPTSTQMNMPIPQICQNAAGCESGGVNRTRGRVPQGKEYLPPSTTTATNSGLPNPYVANTYSWWFYGTGAYHGANLSLVRRMSAGLAFRVNYTHAKVTDLISAPSNSTGTNQASRIWNRYNPRLNHGVAAFDTPHQFNANFSYELPFGAGKRFGAGATGVWGHVIGGWQWNGIVSAQKGFPFTPLTGTNNSGSGDTRAPDIADLNPAFSGPRVLGRVDRWFDPNMYKLPISGTFGDAGKGNFRMPSQVTMDTSLFKNFQIAEGRNLQFRWEAFNVLNHTNLGTPGQVLFSGSNIAPAAGRITSTSTRPRNMQFALRLTF